MDEQGIIDESAEQAFTVNRVSDTMIGGTFLLPFGKLSAFVYSQRKPLITMLSILNNRQRG